MVPWNALEPQDDVFDFTQLDLNVQDAAAGGYRMMLRIMSGRLVPAWLLASGAQTVQVLGTDPNAVDYCQWITSAVPWDPVLEDEYREMLSSVGDWLGQADGSGGSNADHIYLVPISMPTLLGSEMQIGFGRTQTTCPAGTEGEGLSLSEVNADLWHALGTDAELRTWTEAAWRRAIAIHLQVLPENVASVIAYGALFGDAQAAALDIAGTEIGPNRARLWSMYTNLQPKITSGQISGVWKDWCPRCHDVIMAALGDGGSAGFQVASTENTDTHVEFATAVDDAIPRYAMRFLETSLGTVERELDYLLTGPDPVQSRLAAIAGQVLSEASVTCGVVQVGAPSTCTATVGEPWDDPAISPSGEVTWASDGEVEPLTCILDGASSCSVSVTPDAPGPVPVSASYGGDADHLPTTAAGSIDTLKRPSAVTLTCDTPVLAGQASLCTATVTDEGGGSGVAPTGSVTWSVTGGAGLGAASCVLAGTGGVSSCAVSYAPQVAGSATVTATYAGSPVHVSGAASATVLADVRGSETSVSCAPTTVSSGAPTTCTATVGDAGGSGALGPEGSVAWTSVEAGSFAAASCSLAGSGTERTCSVSYTPAESGSHTIRASYGGDAAHEGSAGTASITAVGADVTAPTVQITAPSGATVPKGRTFTIAATATDDRGIARVEFRVNGVLLCTDTGSPYTCAWAVSRKSNVSYAISVSAIDTSGNVAVATTSVRSR